LHIVKWVLAVALLSAPAGLHAGFESESLMETKISGPIVDVVTHSQEDLAFVLIPGEIVIFSTDEQTVLDRIPVDTDFDRIAYLAEDRLVLTAKSSSRIKVIRFNRIYDIDLKGRTVKGPPGAKITLAVFDDYQ